MRIGLVTDFYFPWIAGPAVLLRNLGHALAERGHEIFLLAPSPVGPMGEERDGHVHVTRVPTIPSPFGHGLRVAPRPRRPVARWLEAVRPDVAHVHHPFPISASAIWQAHRRGIPVAATNHTIPECSLFGIAGLPPLYRPASAVFGAWIRSLMNRCDAVAAPTETAARELRGLGYRREIAVLSNGVDTSRFRPGPQSEAMRQRFGLDERPVVLYTGRLDAEKQMDVWVKAALELTVSGIDAQFLIGGNGSERARLVELARDPKLAGRMAFAGYLSDDEFPEVYRLADVYFVTSPVELQSIGTLEALASGLPAVGMLAGALPEIIRDGKNGYLVDRGDWRGAAEKLKALLHPTPDANELRARFGATSRRVALEHDLQRAMSAYDEFLVRTARQQREWHRGGVTVAGR